MSYRKEIKIETALERTMADWEDIPEMIDDAMIESDKLLIMFQANIGDVAPIPDMNPFLKCRVHFRILLNDVDVAGSTYEFCNGMNELRTGSLIHLATNLNPGANRVRIQWKVDEGKALLNFHIKDIYEGQTTQLVLIEI
ncbi:MAG TPA: hypothetical protein VHY08_29055 [Bacillota bacterium]|nr:hypothetical protein [Bacillota bacterium]